MSETPFTRGAYAHRLRHYAGPNCRWRPGVALVLAVFIWGLAGPPDSAVAQGKRDHTDVFYNEAADSYFQIYREHPSRNGANWREAQALARDKSYKGRQGRLAVIDSRELFEWVRQTFQFRRHGYNGHAWIGLRYWCPYRTLRWVNGETHARSAFSPWRAPWHLSGITCSNNNISFMGVFIHGQMEAWTAAGPNKRFPHYIVEYPAPAGS